VADIELWRSGVAALSRWACGGVAGRGKSDPVYVEVTENEHGCPREHYSSCADQVHWIAKRLGIERPWVNRTDDDFGERWKFGVNVSKLNGVCRPVPLSFVPELGDCCISWNRPDTKDAHVWVYLGPNADRPGDHWSGNYGAAGMSAAEFPGARVVSKHLYVSGPGLMYGTRRIQRVLTVPMLVAMRGAKHADFSGTDLTGEVRDALEA